VHELSVTVKTYDGYYYRYRDATNLWFSTAENGWFEAGWLLTRPDDLAYADIGLNMQVFFRDAASQVRYHGAFESVQPVENGFECRALGYWSAVDDDYFFGTLADGTPESQMAYLLENDYMPRLSTDTTALAVTGIPTSSYQTEGGVMPVQVGEVVAAICKVGEANGKRVVPAVWDTGADQKPRLSSKLVDFYSPTPRYLIKQSRQTQPRRVLSAMYTSVVGVYTTGGGVVTRVLVDDTASQNALAVDFSGAGTKQAFIRTRIEDMTGQGDLTTATQATARVQAVLNQLSRPQADSNAITLTGDLSILDLATGQYISLYEVRAGEFARYEKIAQASSAIGGVGAGNAGANFTQQQVFYISKTDWRQGDGSDKPDSLTITPERTNNFGELLANKK
jgi:hypothetical protein